MNSCEYRGRRLFYRDAFELSAMKMDVDERIRNIEHPRHEPRIRHHDMECTCTCGRVWPCIMAFGSDEPRKAVLGDLYAGVEYPPTLYGPNGQGSTEWNLRPTGHGQQGPTDKRGNWPPCHAKPREQWCDCDGPGGFMGHTCYP